MKKFKIVPKKYRFIIYYLMDKARKEQKNYIIKTTINDIEIEQKILYSMGFCFCFNHIAQIFGVLSYYERKRAYKEAYILAGDDAKSFTYGELLRCKILKKILKDNEEYIIKYNIANKANSMSTISTRIKLINK